MEELDLINNEGPNLKIKRFAPNKFEIVDEWGEVINRTDQYGIFDWIDGREKLSDSIDKKWVWGEHDVHSRTPLVEIIKFIFTNDR